MCKLIQIALAVLVALGIQLLSAQEHKDAPTVDLLHPQFIYKSEPCAFTSQHFGNMSTHVFGKGTAVVDSALLHHGRYHSPDTRERSATSVELTWLQKPHQQSNLAVALYDWEWIGGSSSQSNVIQVFGCQGGRLSILQQISNDAHSIHAGANYNPETGVLTVKSVRYGAGAHCCPEKLDIVTFKWAGGGFEQISWETVTMPRSQ
jgi:hypothetical protein